MISERLNNALNTQMNFEFLSAQLYIKMAAYFTVEGYDGLANFFLIQAEEEKTHAMKFYHYLADRGMQLQITSLSIEECEYPSYLDVFKHAFAHEQEVTKRIYAISDIAWDEREHATIQFLKWFIDEQVEEESTFEKLIHKLQHIQHDPLALFMMDEDLGRRQPGEETK